MGTEKGKDVKEVVESDVQLYTSPIVIAEIYSKLKISLKVLCFWITVRRANVSVKRKLNLYESSEVLEYLMRLAFEEAVQQFKIRRKRKAYSALNPKRRGIFGVEINCETASEMHKKNLKTFGVDDAIDVELIVWFL